MTGAALLARAHAAGAVLSVANGRVVVDGASRLPPSVLVDLRAHKAEVLAALTAQANDPAHLPPRAAAATRTADALPSEPAAAKASVTAWAERAAADALDGYEAPEPTSDWPEPERARLESLNRQIAEGYRGAALIRPPSWWRAEAHRPTPGATCSCCRGARWWSRDGCGWCCATCHPHDGTPECEVIEVRT